MRSLRSGTCLSALALALAGCATNPIPTVGPPSAALRARMEEGVVIRAVPTGPAGTFAKDPLLRGTGQSAGYAAKKGAKVGVRGGTAVAAVGCNPAWAGLWIITCPVGLAAGVVVGVGGAAVGGVTGAAYGAAKAHTKEQVDAATAALDASLGEMKPVQALREELVTATRHETAVAVRDDMTPGNAEGMRRSDGLFPIIVALRVDEFMLVRRGALTPELWLQLRTSAMLYDAPEVGRRYERSWVFDTRLGDFYELTDHGAAGLKRAIDAALKVTAATMVNDLFLSTLNEPVPTGGAPRGKVVTIAGGELESTEGWFRENESAAACGELDAQIALGEAYAAVDPKVYGASAQAEELKGYVWLRRAELSGRVDEGAEKTLARLKQRLPSDRVERAERLAQAWHPEQCRLPLGSRAGAS